MRTLALLLIPILILGSTPICFAQGLSSQERLELLRRVEALRVEADAIVRILQANPGVSAASTSPSLVDILVGLKTAIDNINLLVGDARKFLDTTGGAVTKIGNTVDTETKRLSDQMVANLQTANIQITKLLEQVQGFIATSTMTVDKLGSHVDNEMVKISAAIVLNLKGINDEIIKLITQINQLVQTTDQAVRQVGVRVDEELARISTSIQTSLSELTEAVVALTGAVQEFVEISGQKVDQIGNRVDTELAKISAQLTSSIAELTVQVQKLVEATTAFMDETRLALRDIRIAAEQTVSLIRDTDGKVSVGVYAGTHGLNTRADLMVWHRRQDQRAFTTLRIGASDIETSVRPELLLGAAKPPLSLEMGYIEQGIGLRLGYGQTTHRGPDARLQLLRFREPRVDAEIGYSLSTGLRGFLYTDDMLRDSSREFGIGLDFGAGF